MLIKPKGLFVLLDIGFIKKSFFIIIGSSVWQAGLRDYNVIDDKIRTCSLPASPAGGRSQNLEIKFTI